MITIVDGKNCEFCGKNPAIVVCNGCEKALCEECRTFDIWGFGCGHGDPKVFCKICHSDPEINFWRSID